MSNNNRDVEVSGNVIATQANLEREIAKAGNAVHTMAYLHNLHIQEGVYVRSLRFKAPSDGFGEWLGILSITRPEGNFVAFHRATSLPECVVGMVNRYRNGSLQWKEDDYARS